MVNHLYKVSVINSLGDIKVYIGGINEIELFAVTK